jgi:hypothetical protein
MSADEPAGVTPAKMPGTDKAIESEALSVLGAHRCFGLWGRGLFWPGFSAGSYAMITLIRHQLEAIENARKYR